MLRPFFLDLDAETAEAGQGVSTVVNVEGGLYMLLGRRLRLPGPRSSELRLPSLSAGVSNSELVLSTSDLLALRSLEAGVRDEGVGVVRGEAAEGSVASFPPLLCLLALYWEDGREGGGEGDGRRRLGSLRVRVVVRRARV